MMKRFVLALLLLLNLGLGAVLAWMWFTPEGELRSDMHWTPPKAQSPELDDPSSSFSTREPVGVAGFLATLDRPLFSPSRRPPPPPPPPAPPPEPDYLAGVEIQGTLMTEDGGVVLAKVEGKTRRLALGADIGPWKIKEIKDRDVTFVRGENTRVLRLEKRKLGSATPPPPTPPAAQQTNAAPATPADPNAPKEAAAPAPAPGDADAQVRARLELRNQRRAAAGLPPVSR